VRSKKDQKPQAIGYVLLQPKSKEDLDKNPKPVMFGLFPRTLH